MRYVRRRGCLGNLSCVWQHSLTSLMPSTSARRLVAKRSPRCPLVHTTRSHVHYICATFMLFGRQRRDVAASTARYGSHLSKPVENIGERLASLAHKTNNHPPRISTMESLVRRFVMKLSPRIDTRYIMRAGKHQHQRPSWTSSMECSV